MSTHRLAEFGLAFAVLFQSVLVLAVVCVASIREVMGCDKPRDPSIKDIENWRTSWSEEAEKE